jgi:hypothetical protein
MTNLKVCFWAMAMFILLAGLGYIVMQGTSIREPSYAALTPSDCLKFRRKDRTNCFEVLKAKEQN